MAPPVCVAVVSWNTRALLDRCLRSLRADAESGLAEVWVVDNDSRDGSADYVRERHSWATLIAGRENLGYGRAVNLVGAETRSPWLGIANADVELTPGALERLLAAGEADLGAGLLAPRLVLPDGSTQRSVWRFPAARTALRDPWDPEREGRVPWAEGAFLLARREAWEATGGFDPALWLSAEDLDLGWRMRRAGWATRYVPAATVRHEHSAAVRQVWGDDLPLHWQRCAYHWMLRTLGRRRTVAFGVVSFAGAVARRQGRWALVHRYAFAPRRVLARYR